MQINTTYIHVKADIFMTIFYVMLLIGKCICLYINICAAFSYQFYE